MGPEAAGGGLGGGGQDLAELLRGSVRRQRIADHVQMRLLKEGDVNDRRRESVEKSVEFMLVQTGIITPTDKVRKVGYVDMLLSVLALCPDACTCLSGERLVTVGCPPG